MVEKRFAYTTAKIKQPQKVAGIKITSEGGTLTEKEIKAIKKDRYGLSLIDSGMLVIGETPVVVADEKETIPDFDNEEGDSD